MPASIVIKLDWSSNPSWTSSYWAPILTRSLDVRACQVKHAGAEAEAFLLAKLLRLRIRHLSRVGLSLIPSGFWLSCVHKTAEGGVWRSIPRSLLFSDLGRTTARISSTPDVHGQHSRKCHASHCANVLDRLGCGLVIDPVQSLLTVTEGILEVHAQRGHAFLAITTHDSRSYQRKDLWHGTACYRKAGYRKCSITSRWKTICGNHAIPFLPRYPRAWCRLGKHIQFSFLT